MLIFGLAKLRLLHFRKVLIMAEVVLNDPENFKLEAIEEFRKEISGKVYLEINRNWAILNIPVKFSGLEIVKILKYFRALTYQWENMPNFMYEPLVSKTKIIISGRSAPYDSLANEPIYSEWESIY